MGIRAVLLTSIAIAQLLPSSSARAQDGELPVDVADPAPALRVPHPLRRPLVSTEQAAAVGLILLVTFTGDEPFRDAAQEHRNGVTNAIGGVGNVFGESRYVLPVLGAGYLMGEVAGSRVLRRVAMQAGRAVIIAGGVTTVLKYTLGRTRPSGDGESDQFSPFSGSTSFPSGHTAVAFAVATALADETKDPWTDIALYGAATATAFARVNGDRHWTSDVLAGALVGHLSARWLTRRQGPLTVGPRSVGLSLEF
jgi:membrane-associated phospholipid phosphatase